MMSWSVCHGTTEGEDKLKRAALPGITVGGFFVFTGGSAGMIRAIEG